MMRFIDWQSVHITANPFASFLDQSLSSIVALFAERLPILCVPEQLRVPFVRNDVIDDRRRHKQPSSLAEHAERMMLQIRRPDLAPARTVDRQCVHDLIQMMTPQPRAQRYTRVTILTYTLVIIEHASLTKMDAHHCDTLRVRQIMHERIHDVRAPILHTVRKLIEVCVP